MSKQKNTSIGIEGEVIAFKYLEAKGYALVEVNYHTDWGEIDLIVSHKDIIVFVEVKLRKNSDYGLPEVAVSQTKIKKITKSAIVWIESNDWKGEIRFDIISILQYPKPNEERIFHIEDAFIGDVG